MTEYERVVRLAAYVGGRAIRPEQIERMPPEERWRLERRAGVRMCTLGTWHAVLDRLRTKP